jgi:hypothetical protein
MIGLLWFDNDKKRPLEEKVKQAVEAYCGKPHFAGQVPDTCYVHPTMLQDGQEVRLDGVRVIAATNMPPYHFLVGTETERKKTFIGRR